VARVTLEDVAKKAGVSFKTVSRVLNNEPNVAPKTLEKVKQAIADLNYVPNSAARNLSRGKARSIGLVLGWPVNSPYSSTLIDYTLDESMAEGYGLALFSMKNKVTNQIVDAFLGRQVDGVILDTNAAADADLMQQIDSLNIPHVIIHPDRKNGSSKASYVEINNYLGARQAVDYLIELGHRAIGCISYASGLYQEIDRTGGHRDALIDAGLPYHPEWVFQGSELPFQVGVNGALSLLPNHPQLTALFVCTDEMAMGTVSAIWRLGLNVPNDISVVGFDDISHASMIAPSLTTIHQPIDEIARISVKHLIEKIDDPETAPINIVLPTRLVVRETCKPLKIAERPTP
jgi:DNA-binding LacI/PurR family transcriptional regulator